MTRTIFYTATTLDGFLADPDDSLDWLLRQDLEEGGPGDYSTFLGGVGAIVMGSTTYEWVLAHENGEWGYDLPAFVFTTRELPLPTRSSHGGASDVRFRRGSIADALEEMHAAAGERDLWVVGGGDLAGQFADVGALHEVLTSIAPVTLGAGRPLLPRRLDLELLKVSRNAGFVVARYRVVGRLREDVQADGASSPRSVA
ncbi:dihydrofolate reductase family protein [Leucobacter japonicus]|uniref:dihydrofolate reductase family protein n=1 Tax=Leucobacter japonicus TaxID=1461259 RepID=UPI0006A7A60B|nr:dihydrofolate reductase family protein [Leucobacter japonicus]